MGKTTIEWCDYTFNPWVGCTKVSAACDHCYAETWAKRSGHPELWQGERRRTKTWGDPLKWARATHYSSAVPTPRPRVFCASLADVFDNQVPPAWRDDLWELIRATPELDWLLLTKRPMNIAKMLPPFALGIPYHNVWLGTTAEDQTQFDLRWHELRQVPAVVHFISYEPALGPLTLGGWKPSHPDWIICGGESGAHARPMDPAWARKLRDECQSWGVAYFFKQMTRKAAIPADLLVRQFPTPHRTGVPR